MALVQEGINYKVRISECVRSFVWLLTVEVLSNAKHFVTVLYHSPQKENARFVEYFGEHLDRVSDYGGTNLIFGDFNFDLLKPSFYSDKLLNKIYLKGFSQIVAQPTRITNQSSTLIDFIVSNNKRLKHAVHLTPKISDHNILTASLNEKLEGDQYVTIYRRNTKDYNVDFIRDSILDTCWNNSVSDVNVLASHFISSVTDVLNELCPKQELRIKHQYRNKHWITGEIRHMMGQRDSFV